MTKERRLLIDDMRDETSPNIMCRLDVIARNYTEGINQLSLNGPWDKLYLDHDLSSYDESGREFTGYDIACFLERNPEYMPGEIIVVSSNPEGARRIKSVFDAMERRSNR